MSDSPLRPAGTVEVNCSKKGCGWSFWVEALDPRLPGGPFICPMCEPPQPGMIALFGGTVGKKG